MVALTYEDIILASGMVKEKVKGGHISEEIYNNRLCPYLKPI
jgi:hypothetical protein